MAVAVSPPAESSALTRGERSLARWLRLFALLFLAGAAGFLLRPDDTVRDLDRVGALVGLPTLAAGRLPVASDFWLPLAIANMATIAACSWLAAADVRGRRALVYPVVVSKLASSATGILLFVRWCPAFPFLTVALVDLPIAVILLTKLRGAAPTRA
jgi:hypothetical protein